MLRLTYVGESRIPDHQLIAKKYSESFYLYNAQITKKVPEI